MRFILIRPDFLAVSRNTAGQTKSLNGISSRYYFARYENVNKSRTKPITVDPTITTNWTFKTNSITPYDTAAIIRGELTFYGLYASFR